MADGLVQIALERLTVGIQDEYGLLVGAKKEVQKLQSTFTAIRSVISDAERRQLKEESLKDWLRKLKDVAYEVDDVLDEWTTSFLRHEGNDKVCSPLTCSGRFLTQLQLRHRVGSRVREINERLDQISEEKDKYKFQELMMEEKEKRETTSLVDTQKIFGREKEKEDVISKLISESSHANKDIPIISIVGMGGMGKTSLAQIVYNDERVKDHFALRIWLCVADDFKVEELTRKIVESASGTKYKGPSDLSSMQSHICELVNTKRFLVVLDDVWNDNSTKWEQWSLPLRKGAQGSRIVVTTRIHNVSRMMDPTHTYDLQVLSEEDCWLVFTSKAFLGRTREECLKFEEIGRKINRKCDGLPLAAKTIGSVMQSKRRKQDWFSMLESKMWEEIQDGPLPALLISYDNLPSHLKPCFLYCSVFQKDEQIVKNDLIKLWMAQGLICTTQRGNDIEDIGGEYFDDLIDRSLFQDVEKDSFENITRCKMHDLVHDLVRFVANEEYFVPDSQGQVLNPIPTKARHLSYISVDVVDSIPSHLYNASTLRTLLSLKTKTIPRILFDHLRCLRTLDLSESHFETLPGSIKHLKHLRYFDLSWCTSLRKLPKQVSSLYNLQTLKLNSCFELCELPEGLARMASLRHLEIEGRNKLEYTPKGIGGMNSLRTLSRFIVGTEHGYNSKIGELKSLNQLQGNLKISHLERVAGEDEANSVELAKKEHLKSLTLHWESVEGAQEKIEGIFESLKPSHEYLQMLRIKGYYGSKIPSWMQEMSLFTKLIEVRLVRCTNIKQLPSLGMLPFLKDLKISGNSDIERVGQGFIGDGAVAFPKLEKLEFRYMKKWIEWEMRSLGNEKQIRMPCLRRLTIIGCLKLKSWPELGKLTSLEYLQVEENEVVERVGHELYGHCDGGDDANGIAFPKLKELCFGGMSKWEDWELSVENVQMIMPALLSLTIKECPHLKSVPECLLAKLVTLEIRDCNEIIWMSSTSTLPCLANLEKLRILMTKSLPHNGWEQLESLHTLDILFCEELTSLPDKLGQLKSLHILTIERCRRLESLPTSIGQLESLHTLTIQGCCRLESLPTSIGQLESLHTLDILFCEELTSLPDKLGQLKSLHTLRICGCPRLESLPTSIGQLESLHTLRIHGCHQLESLPTSIGQLESLHTLDILFCEELTSLPDQLGQLKSLHTLWIQGCRRLESLPTSIGQLKALQQLSICDCDQLKSLPDELTQLQSLHNLYISGCSQLRAVLCDQQQKHLNFWKPSSSVASKVGGGEDWHKIKHIPNIIIDGETIQSEGDG